MSMAKKPKHAKKLSPEALATLKKHREAQNALRNQTSDGTAVEQSTSRRSVNQRANQIFKRGGQ